MTTQKPILIEISRLIFRLIKGKTITGIDRVTLAYIKHYAKHAQAVLSYKGSVHILTQVQSEKLFQILCQNQPKLLHSSFFNVLTEYVFKNESDYSQYAGCVYLNLNHKGIESKSYIRKIQQLQLKTVFFVHDLIPVNYPEYCRAQEQAKHALRIRHMLQVGHAIIVNSAFTKAELLQFAQTQKLTAPPITVALLSSDLHHLLAPPKLLPVLQHKKYFVVLATIEARKNHLLLLQIWQRLIQQLGKDAPYLVLVGQRGWEADQVFNLLDRCELVKRRVIECSSSCDVELKATLLNAQALLFPSFVEGFGLPLVEALSLGVPVIASDIEVFREIGQGVPEFIDTLDTKLWYDMILEYNKNASLLRQDQLLRMKHYQHWEWQDHFNAIQYVIEPIERVEAECH